MKTRKIAAVLLLLAGALVACSPAGDSGGGSGTSPNAPMRIGFSAWPGWFPLQVALEKGLFEAEGQQVELIYFESYTDSLNALTAGQLDANAQTLGDTIPAIAAGARQRIVLVNDNSTGNDQIIVRPGINSIAELKGKKIGVEEGLVDHFLLLLGLEKEGLSNDDVEIQPLLTDAAASAFAAGQLDAVGAFAPFTSKALELEGSRVLFSSKDFPGAIPDHIVFAEQFVQSRPGDVQKLVDVWFKTLDFIAANRDEAVAIMASKAGVTPEEYLSYDAGTTIFSVEDNLKAFQPGSDMTHLDFAAKRISDFLVAGGLVDSAPDLTGLLDDTFVKKYAGRS
ncbi:MAG: ABC transporter substrate-binding protein [Actinomycetota bacterium]